MCTHGDSNQDYLKCTYYYKESISVYELVKILNASVDFTEILSKKITIDTHIVKDYKLRVLRLLLNFFYSDASITKAVLSVWEFSQNDS